MKKPNKSMCSGCEDSPYWHGLGGSHECWSFKTATIIKRIPVGTWQRPPYDFKEAKPMLSCYHKKQMFYVKPESLRGDGYWK